MSTATPTYGSGSSHARRMLVLAIVSTVAVLSILAAALWPAQSTVQPVSDNQPASTTGVDQDFIPGLPRGIQR